LKPSFYARPVLEVAPDLVGCVVSHAGTSGVIVEKLNHAVNDGLRSADVRASLAKLGVEPKIGAPTDFEAALAEQVHDWKAVVEATGIKLE